MATTGDAVKGDRTSQAIARQLKAMGCDRYEIGIRDATTGKMMNKVWTPTEVIENAGWLKRMNAQGNDIYIRPAEQAQHGLVLVDDLSEADLAAMTQEGREPALVIETSPKNYQAWVKFGADATADHRLIIARELAREYDADPGSVGHHYGRLAGFTNQKPKHTTGKGYQPWVLCRASSGRTATTGPQMVLDATQELEGIERSKEQGRRLASIEAGPQRRYHLSAVEQYRSEMKGLLKRFPDDLSKCDFIAAMKLAQRGIEPDEIAHAMAEASPGLMERKAGHEADYIERTVKAVMETPEVQEASAKRKRDDREYSGPRLR